ncbi:MAG: HlyD family efflux transporter periplasmic adaptor subunit [Bacteroidales bacterium]
MRRYLFLGIGLLPFLLIGCKSGNNHYDAMGVFEATEVVVSSETQGKIIALNLQGGDTLMQGQRVGVIDSLQLYLQKKQLMANNRSVAVRNVNVGLQVAALEEQIIKQEREKARFANLFENKAASQKQVDDIDAQLKVLKRQLVAQKEILNNNNQGIFDETDAISLQIAQLSDQLAKCHITNPIRGTVLTKYAEAGEFATPGKPLFKIGDLNRPFLRVYLTSGQLFRVKTGQQVEVIADYGGGDVRTYSGVIASIGDKAEFTPKGIQTNDERANLVYPVKVQVVNDGYIRIGMYGGIRLPQK